MARRSSFASAIAQMQREAARAQAAQLRAQATAQREAVRAHAAYQRALAANERESKRLYAESRQAEVAAMNEQLEARLVALDGVLAHTLDVDDRIEFASLKVKPSLPAWSHAALESPTAEPQLEQFLPAPPSGMTKLFGKGKHEKALQAAHEQY